MTSPTTRRPDERQPRPSVCILLATYNGGRFIEEQIRSLQAQTFSGWRLLVRDDGSRDRTVEIVAGMARRDPRIELFRDRLGNVGPARNFGLLMEHPAAAASDYLMCCDQDDVWDADKVERTLAAALGAGVNEPLLVHTDLAVADAALRVVHPSFMRFQGIRDVPARPLRTLLVQNFVTGCTVLFNQALRRLATPIPRGVVMHDWWLAVCAAAAGRIEFLPTPTLRYRQHGNNQVGARGFWRAVNPFRAGWTRLPSEATTKYLNAVRQGRLLQRRLGERADPEAADALRLLDEFCRIFDGRTGRLARVRGILRNDFRRQGHLRNLLLLLCGGLVSGRRYAETIPLGPESEPGQAARAA